MKKDKIYELKIEEDDVISGIDSISLVSEPAIEVNWVAFNKVKQEEFLIPDGEDLKYSEMITQKGHSEEELFNQGWKVHSTKLMKGDFVSSSPNSPSFEDTDEYLVRYKYVLNPEAPGSPVKSTTRDFCRDLISKNYVYRVEDLDGLQNDLGSSALVWRGSYNCRHIWQQIRYHKDTNIVNKGSVTRGRIDGEESYDVIGYQQPDTRVPEWPSFSKSEFGYPLFEKREDAEAYAVILGCQGSHEHKYGDKVLYMPCEKHPEDLGYDVGGITPYVDELPTGKTYDTFETYNDYPESASNNACKVLKWREEHGDEVKGMTQVGWTRANQLCKKENISEETIARMSAFQRHRQNAEVSAENKSTPWKDAGYVAWLGWGGTTGIEWASRKLESIRRQKMSKQSFQIDSEKKMVVGPAMIPDLYIPRVDKNKNVYYVYFTAETIKMIAEKYMRYKYIDNNDTEHNGEAAEDVYVVESWIKEDQSDKSNKYGYQDLPIGTWFVSMKVRNPEVWERVKKGELKGFSVSGFFEEIEKFYKEKEFLKQLADLLKDIE
jgi:hypothetical protein